MKTALRLPLPAKPGPQFARFLLAILAIALVAKYASAQDIRLSESFDQVSIPDLPTDWSGSWATSSSSSSNGSGENNLADTGTGDASVTTGTFSLSGAGAATLSYRARRTGSYPAEAVSIIFVTQDGDFAIGNSGLPEASSSWVELSFSIPGEALDQEGVRIRLDSSGGTSSGANARIDDMTVSVTGAPATGGAFGFTTSTVDVLAGSSGVLLPLTLNWSGPESLQGLQFAMTGTGANATLTGIQRGAALLDLSAWTLSREADTVLLIGNGTIGLAPGLFDPLISAVFDFADVTDTTLLTLDITELIGAEAVPAGNDASLTVSTGSKTIRILPRVGIFQVADSLELGSVQVGDLGSKALWLFNRGTATLSISQISTNHAAFSVSPSSASIQAGDSLQVAVTYTPTASDLGLQTASILFDGVAETTLFATGQASWGDATDDGIVDVGDIVYGVDVVLGRVLPSSDIASSLDLFPFPEGDGSIDVRDLTVLTQAVLRGQWPNAVALPARNQISGKRAGNVSFRLQEGILSVQVDEPMRGLQAWLSVKGEATRIGEAVLHRDGETVTLLWVRLDGGEIPLGEHDLMLVEGAVLLDGVAIGPEHQRTAVAMELPDDAALGRPFPNPFSPSQHGLLSIPGQREVRVIDLLGRSVWEGSGAWDGQDRTGRTVAAGLYSVQVGKNRYPIVIVR